ncbi:SUN domain-containing protein 2 [Syngnathoides biaculeatus]|uniref:SUN domain-containing protein 2 n=1 Tax=Syngnathoides biaculeatus TaxID=300417 RepID=UPI002ADDDFE3|nr:SUN domain-containing protein 2 [Syngnathoides biaculeatus]XP_061685869.1 SUN domain-containing protein 2 [Syngnathoides biaculeatus]
MSRRSCRLASTGYYNSDEESDSSSVTNISYRENPVKVFKKKAGTRKAASRASTRTGSNASTSRLQSPSNTARRPSLSTQTSLTMGSVSYTTPRPTPRPSLTPASSTAHQTAPRPPAPPPERFRSSGQAVVYLRPDHKEQDKNCVDSSGYSSSEGINFKPPTPTTTATTARSSTSSVKSNDAAPRVGHSRRINDAFCAVKGSLSRLTAKIKHLFTADRSLISAQTKTTCLVLILFSAVAAFVWFLPPLLPLTLVDFMKAPSQIAKLKSHFIPPAVAPAPSSTVKSALAKDVVTVPTHIEAKMQHLMEELQLKQELLYKIKEQFEVDMQSMRDDMKVLESNSGRHLDQEVTVLGKKMDDQKRDLNKSLSDLGGRMKALETRIAKLSKELLSIQSQPPSLPCPDISAQKQLTPELQQAMEKWLTDHIQAQNAVILQQKGISSVCTQPFANKMADFALETQGASVISTRCSETYRTRSACLSLFGFPLWYPTESPRTVIRGEPVLLPGKCWAFHGAHGTLVIALSHPIRISHVTLDHVPRHSTPNGRIDSAPKDFAVYAMKKEVEEGTHLGTFTYNQDGEPTQTFELPPSEVIYNVVELRVLSNWGHMEYTCLYRFRVHGTLAAAT